MAGLSGAVRPAHPQGIGGGVMAECRYYAMCDRAVDDWLPCDGTDDGTVCGHFEPMPDVQALLELADDVEDSVKGVGAEGPLAWMFLDIAKSIRKACGVVE